MSAARHKKIFLVAVAVVALVLFIEPSILSLFSIGCQGASIVVVGSSLAPLVENGQTVVIRQRDCVTIERGDLIVFKTSAHPSSPLIKRVGGVPGDKIDLAENGQIKVNGKAALAPNGSPYVAPEKTFSNIEFFKGVIPVDTYFVLGITGSLDSSRLGLISKSGVLGVVKMNSVHHPA